MPRKFSRHYLFYDLQGLAGFSYTKNGTTKYYAYVTDLFGNIIAIEDEAGKPMIRYEYDLFGKPTSYVNVASKWYASDSNTGIQAGITGLAEWKTAQEILKLTPFLWKGFYYDYESGYYYVSGRYYDPEAGVYLDAEDLEEVFDSPIGGLSRDTITTDNHLNVVANSFDIFPQEDMTADKTYDPEQDKSWWEKNWFNVVLLIVQAVAGAIMLFVPCMQAVGAMLLSSAFSSGLSMLAAAISPGAARVLSGHGTFTAGMSAIQTGISLFACGPVGWIAGTVCIAVGAATAAIGVNEMVAGATGTNYLREWTGWSQKTYETIYTALNTAATVCTIAGQAIRGLKGCRCFITGTLVLTAAGYKKIEEIEEGDLVLAYDEKTGEQVYKPVVQLFRNESRDWTEVTVNGEKIVSTPGHKYYLPETKEWIAAESLKIGNKVLLSNGEYGIIENVKAIHYDTPQTTYNFEVADVHTYYVGNGVLVHNKGGCEGKGFDSRTVAGPEDVGKYKDVRIDVEVGGSGSTNIHMQAKGLDKMMYSNGTFPTAPKKLRESKFAQDGIAKALNLIKRRGY